ncbi:hypothetical protein VNO77_43014 [Canavalia gladiata]|uniref:RING-type domain-containing protein n=1 Tax=Canavalia gladiata TaxID=3824 RepID=A0AAN9JVK2_CANGL
MTKWFSGMTGPTTRFKEVFSTWLLAGSRSYAFELFMKVVKRVLFAEFTCILVLGGSIMGIIAGAIKGQTTEAGFLDGASKGVVTGAIAALELLNFADDDEPGSKFRPYICAIGHSLVQVQRFSQSLLKWLHVTNSRVRFQGEVRLVALLRSLLNGKVFMEWICPTVAQAYQCHIINAQGTTYREVSDIYNDIVSEVTIKGIAHNIIQNLPIQQFSKMLKSYNVSCCSICFQDFEDEELVRVLPKCGHFYHLVCIDKWLVQQGSCPMCRNYVPHI